MWRLAGCELSTWRRLRGVFPKSLSSARTAEIPSMNGPEKWRAGTPTFFFDLSGSSLTKMRDRLADFRKIFWWTGTKWKTTTPEDDPNAFVKLVFGSDEGLDGIAPALAQYRAMFE